MQNGDAKRLLALGLPLSVTKLVGIRGSQQETKTTS